MLPGGITIDNIHLFDWFEFFIMIYKCTINHKIYNMGYRNIDL
jgi:hypothetical protein